MQPLISVIIPVFDCERYILEAVNSVLGQTYYNIELIVVDDGSTDATLEVLSSLENDPRMRIISQINGGTANARNAGIAKSRGQYLAFLDADDYWSKDKLELQFSYLADTPECKAVFGHASNFLDSSLTDAQNLKLISNEVKVGMHPGCMLIRTDAFASVGLFRGDEFAEFIEWWSRFEGKCMSYHILPETLMYRRVHRKNKTLLHTPELVRSYLRIAKKSKDLKKDFNVSVS